MEEIKVGESVRAEDGFIGKVKNIRNAGKGNRYYGEELNKTYYDVYFDECIYHCYKSEEIVKHSSNIIDLIEVGDYVNGKKIDAIIKGNWKSEGVAERVLCFETDFPIEKGLRAYHDCDIKSIVTKEQFANIEYRIGENNE